MKSISFDDGRKSPSSPNAQEREEPVIPKSNQEKTKEPGFQSEEAQGAIHEYVVRNAPQIMKEVEAKMEAVADTVEA